MRTRSLTGLAVVASALSPLVMVTPALAQVSPPMRSLSLWYRQPAKNAMNEALPIGNGRLGALVFGDTTNERLVLNEDSLWTGGLNPSGGYDIKEFGSYQTFGDLLISSGAAKNTEITVPSGQKAFYEAESVAASIDNNPATKWAVEHGGKPVVWQRDLGTPRQVNSYSFTSANDVPARDPQNWELEGSNDSIAWTSLDKRQNAGAFTARGQAKNYTFMNTTAYRYYRFTFTPNLAVPHFQVAEIALGGVSSPANSTTDTNYRRELDIEEAIARTTFTRGGVHHVRETFASHPAQVLVWRWSADKPGAVSGRIELEGKHGETTTAQGDTLTFTGTLDNGLRYEAQARVVARGGVVRVVDGALNLDGCDEATVFVAMGTNYAMNFATGYRGTMPPLKKQLDAAVKQGFTALKTAHTKDYKTLFGRVKFDVGASTAAQKALPTDLRKVEAFSKPDPELETLLFQYGRYLMVSSSRPGGLPANLQGLWNDSNSPAWYSDYHANINIQMNYWPVETANLAECHLPLFYLVLSQLPAWRKATQDSPEWKTPSGEMTKRGFALRTSHNTMGGLGWQWDNTANAWYCQHFWEHYAFGRDKKYLRFAAYPILKETVQFWEDHLKTLPDGRLVVPNGWSPEHGPHEDGVSYNQQIVWDLFTNYLEASAVLGVDADYATKVKAMREKLVGPKIGKWGQLQEWMEDRDDPNDHHRHTSNLFAVFPGRQIDPVKTPELAKAAKVSLDARGIDPGSDVREWSFAWRTALYARLGDGEQAHTMLQNLFSDRNTCLNLFGLHPPMQIDGNFGITAGIAEMLLQSQGEQIVLLPAIPAVWANGSVSGLRARGGITVGMTWRNGKLQSATLVSANAGTPIVRFGSKTAKLKLAAGKSVKLNSELKIVK